MQRDMVLNFGKVVTGFYYDKMKDEKTIIGDTTKTGYFDSNLYPILLGWLPLSETYKQDISIYDYNPSAKIGVIKASVKNVSSSTIKTDKNGSYVSVNAGYASETIQQLELLKELFENGKYTAVIDKTIPMDKTAEAHRYVDTGRKKGNVVLRISE